MKVAVNTRFLQAGHLEGVGNFTWEICRRLPDLLPEAEFLFCFDRPFDSMYTATERTEGRVIFPPARHPLLWKWWFDYSLPRVVRKWGADVIWQPDGYCSLRTSIPQVTVMHDIAFVRYPDAVPARVLRYYRKYTPRFLSQAKRVLTVSHFVKNDLQYHFGVPEKKIRVTHNGVKSIFFPLSEAERAAVRDHYAGGRPYFLYVGAVHPRKNIERLIIAYDLYRRQNPDGIPLLIGGRLAWQTDGVRAAYDRSAFRADIRMLGYVAEAELPRLLNGALALVYPSLDEGFGVPLLEAMHAEVPVVCSDRASLPEVGGTAARYFNPEDPAAIAAALTDIVRNPALRARLVAAGRTRKARYTWDASAHIVADTLRQAAGQPNIS